MVSHPFQSMSHTQIISDLTSHTLAVNKQEMTFIGQWLWFNSMINVYHLINKKMLVEQSVDSPTHSNSGDWPLSAGTVNSTG